MLWFKIIQCSIPFVIYCRFPKFSFCTSFTPYHFTMHTETDHKKKKKFKYKNIQSSHFCCPVNSCHALILFQHYDKIYNTFLTICGCSRNSSSFFVLVSVLDISSVLCACKWSIKYSTAAVMWEKRCESCVCNSHCTSNVITLPRLWAWFRL